MTGRRIAAAMLLAGAVLATVGLVVVWILVPLAGAVMTLVLGLALGMIGWQALTT